MLLVWPEIGLRPDDDRVRSPSSCARNGIGEAGRVFWWVLGICTVGVLLLGASVPVSHGHGHRVIRVTGQLVWQGTGEPVVGARVLTVSQYDLETEWDPESAWSDVEAIDAEREEMLEAGYEEDLWCAVGLYGNAGARSEAGGRVETLVGLPSTTYSSVLFSRTHVDEPQEEVAALWVAQDGKEPVLVRLEEGQFRESEGGEEPSVWGTYDIGTVVVPVVEQP